MPSIMQHLPKQSRRDASRTPPSEDWGMQGDSGICPSNPQDKRDLEIAGGGVVSSPTPPPSLWDSQRCSLHWREVLGVSKVAQDSPLFAEETRGGFWEHRLKVFRWKETGSPTEHPHGEWRAWGTVVETALKYKSGHLGWSIKTWILSLAPTLTGCVPLDKSLYCQDQMTSKVPTKLDSYSPIFSALPGPWGPWMKEGTHYLWSPYYGQCTVRVFLK